MVARGLEPPSPTACAGVVANEQLIGKGRRIRGRTGRHAPGLASLAPHSMAQARHQGESNSGIPGRQSNNVDREVAIALPADQKIFAAEAQGPGKELEEKLKPLRQKNRKHQIIPS